MKAVEYFLKERIAGNRRIGGGQRVHPLRLHLRGHQQPGPCPDDPGGPRPGPAAADGRADRGDARPGAALRRPAHARRAPTASRPPPPRWARRWRTSATGCTASASRSRRCALLGKINGAVGNYNAHLVGLPGRRLARLRAGLRRVAGARPGTPTPPRSSRTTTWPNCSTRSVRFNTVLLDFCARPLGLHLARLFQAAHRGGRGRLLDHAAQGQPDRLRERRGQSGVANAMFDTWPSKLPISRWQRDLTDSTVLRNLGVGIAHTSIACNRRSRGSASWRPTRRAWPRPGRQLGGAGRTDPDRDAPLRRRAALREAQGADARPAHRRRTLRASSTTWTSRPRPRPQLRALTPASYIGNAAAQAKRV